MAVIIPTLGTIKGKLGGVCFQVNPAGNILRAKPNSRFNLSNKQRQQHIEQQRWLSLWQLLPLEVQTSWNYYASLYPRTNYFGQSKTVTGFNWFESANSNRVSVGESMLISPPTHYIAASAPEFSVDTNEAQITVSLDTSFDYTNTAVVVWATTPTLRSSNSLNRIRKKVLVITETPAYPLDITTEWETATGLEWAPSVNFPNAKIHVCINTVDKRSGTVSPYVFSINPAFASASSFYYYSS